jgi:CRISPR-associated endonuclease/helicase Cas3
MATIDFDTAFAELTGNQPLSWQRRLFRERFATGQFPPVIDLPTGLGKTSVMAIWLIAVANDPGRGIPRRLIYVVDRRTVVDQATDLAILLKNKSAAILPAVSDLAVSTLRGRLADNREWTRDPSRPAIVIGTVDLIGSALLFSGYRSSYKRRPLEAGMLGRDSLLVLDEAHLSKPFEGLLKSIGQFNKPCSDGISAAKPMCVIRMSATSTDANGAKTFRLLFGDDGNLTGMDAADKTVAERFGAPKTLRVVESYKPAETIANEASELATRNPGSRIVVFVQTPRQVADVRKALERKKKEYATRIAQLTGTMRGLERDDLVDVEKPLGENDHERRAMQRFLKPENDRSQGECFLVSTSAGEVGFDLNADHLVGDEAPLDSWIQRLGRVNRRGKGKATVILTRRTKPPDKTEFDRACTATSVLLTDRTDVSPKALAAFRESLTAEQLEEASFPPPTTVELTEILLDVWSMTSIVEPMPGRPEVGPWLRGIAQWESPQTTIAWRAELDADGFADLDLDDIEEWFDTHPIMPHETLSVRAGEAAIWLKHRWDVFPELRQSELDVLPVIIDRAGLEVVPLRRVITRLSTNSPDADAILRGALLVVPASFGGIRPGIGILDPAEPRLNKADERLSPAEQAGILTSLHDSIDVADVRGRFRETIEKLEDGEVVSRAIDRQAHKPDRCSRYALDLVTEDDRIVRLVSYVPRREKPEVGMKPETLQEHVGEVRKAAGKIIAELELAAEDPVGRALELAADWHDHGKVRERWQRLLIFPKGFIKRDQPMAKSGGEMKRDPRGYRHEFGSLREFADAFNLGRLLDHADKPINHEIFDLASHLIATHHGRGRPNFPKGGFDPDCESRSSEIHSDAVRRFARLQRKYGWWGLAWLENLLRCADAMASTIQDAEDDPAGAESDAV